MEDSTARYRKGLKDGRDGSFEKDASDIPYLRGVETSLRERGLERPIRRSPAHRQSFMGNEWQEWESGLLNKLVTHGKPNMDDAFPSRQFDLEPILRQAMSAPRSLLL